MYVRVCVSDGFQRLNECAERAISVHSMTPVRCLRSSPTASQHSSSQAQPRIESALPVPQLRSAELWTPDLRALGPGLGAAGSRPGLAAAGTRDSPLPAPGTRRWLSVLGRSSAGACTEITQTYADRTPRRSSPEERRKSAVALCFPSLLLSDRCVNVM